MNEVVVVPTGTANIASILAGLERAGARPRLLATASEVTDAARLVLPGVGTFGAAMERLQEQDLVAPLRSRIAADRPTLAICVGLQVLFERSAESPGAEGLGCVPGEVGRFAADLRVPHFGWNQIAPDDGSRFVEAGYAYFANSYRVTTAPPGWTVAWSDYGGRFVAALERGNVLACQFHPELSTHWGRDMLSRWLAAGNGDGGASC